jgi:two-component system chemotaxis response regulator CheB
MSAPAATIIRVLVVDDSALVRKILADGLSRDPEIQVVGQASDPYRARDLLVQLRPDVMTLDVEMPRMDGVTFLKRFMPILPTPTVIVSSLTQHGKSLTLEALAAGAVDVVAKPVVGLVDGLPTMLDDIIRRVKAAAKANVSRASQVSQRPNGRSIQPGHALDETTDTVIAIGASTGGVEALSRILPTFPADAPGIVVVQHMPVGFTAAFAERLNTICKMRVKEATKGDRVMPGQILIAPGGKQHLSVVRSGGEYRIVLEEGPEINFSRPSVDVLFESVARGVGRNAAAALLTGMGKDGAAGLLAIRRSGGRTIAQNEATCVIYGMPQAAVQLGGAEVVAALGEIPTLLVKALRKH